MMWRIDWSSRAGYDLQKLPGTLANRIVAKMEWYIRQEAPLRFAKRLTDSALGTYRFRIGDYRVLCDVHREEITVLEVLSVRDRKNAYRQ